MIVVALLTIGGVAAILVVVFTLTSTSNTTSQEIAEAQREDAVRVRTDIEVIAVSSNLAGTKVDVWIKNVGVSTIGAIEFSDVFLIQPDTRFEALTYNNDGVTSKTWFGDLKENGTPWNRGDTLHITITFSGADVITGPNDFILRMFTPNGKVGERIFGSYAAGPTPTPSPTATPTPPPPFVWYVHSESTSINAVNYYQLKDGTSADGTATTISSSIPAATTGRIRPTSNNGKSVFPLTGETSIGANTWTTTYRVKRDKADTVWWNTSWLNRRKISFDNSASTGDLDNFPVLVALTSSDINYAKTQDQGQDIRFIDDDGTTELNYEIGTWDEAGTSIVWVKVPQIDAASTTDHIWLYFNNTGAAAKHPSPYTPNAFSQATWESRYKGVWHLNENTDDNAVDATSNPNDGSPVSSPAASPGKIDRALTFTSTSRLDIAAHASLDLTTYSDWTLSAWVKPTDYTGLKWPLIYSYGNYRASLGLTVAEGTDGLIENWINDGALEQSDTAVTFNDWNYVVVTRDGTDTRFYLNGVADGTGGVTTVTSTGQASHIGNDGTAANNQFLGLIDEVRVSAGSDSASSRSAEWIAAQYKAMTLTFQKPYGAEETNSVNLTVHADMNVLVRQADGGIRSTLDTNVANSANITGTAWTTFTATYAFPGYTVLFDTDYLEIDLFAEATANSSTEAVSVDFRIDDSSLGTVDQTKIAAP